MKQIQLGTRKMIQWLFIGLILILAAINWFINERHERKAPTKTEQRVLADIPQNLGQYDTVMAQDKLGQNRTAKVDYYMLALSWSPGFCEIQKHKNEGDTPRHLQYQCGEESQFGWVIHGLWPQSRQAREPADHPRFCQGDLPPLPVALIKQYLPESPGAALLQGQWEKHGACAFDSAEQYFAKQKALFDRLVLPNEAMSRKALFQWLKSHNPELKTAYLGASKNELYICYDRHWNVMDCPR
ncbi:ribonuclease [Muribacter muris]|uniref:Ribonuclease n=1 Tax=Muribacter muris TaxID=67855 RepID=A0A4Y9JZ86_9PAST|nr:ribonuclease [Muribacter muris]MBF0784863.1 ribonuclease [Muribacter muris]MBF0828431.1 ribonuclease [Muribacter muris]TFV11093.1 ribonuclease [Muribacter muris]